MKIKAIIQLRVVRRTLLLAFLVSPILLSSQEKELLNAVKNGKDSNSEFFTEFRRSQDQGKVEKWIRNNGYEISDYEIDQKTKKKAKRTAVFFYIKSVKFMDADEFNARRELELQKIERENEILAEKRKLLYVEDGFGHRYIAFGNGGMFGADLNHTTIRSDKPYTDFPNLSKYHGTNYIYKGNLRNGELYGEGYVYRIGSNIKEDLASTPGIENIYYKNTLMINTKVYKLDKNSTFYLNAGNNVKLNPEDGLLYANIGELKWTGDKDSNGYANGLGELYMNVQRGQEKWIIFEGEMKDGVMWNGAFYMQGKSGYYIKDGEKEYWSKPINFKEDFGFLIDLYNDIDLNSTDNSKNSSDNTISDSEGSNQINQCYTSVREEYETFLNCESNGGKTQVYSVRCSNGKTKKFYFCAVPSGLLDSRIKGYNELVSIGVDTNLSKDKIQALEKLCSCN